MAERRNRNGPKEKTADHGFCPYRGDRRFDAGGAVPVE
jgi:hypothetical protein